MSATICPAVLASTPDEYREQMERVEAFATRIHVDVTDGDFAVAKTVGLDNVWWRGNRTIDLHVMYKYPTEHSEIILAMRPRLVIVHAEAEGNFMNFASHLRSHGIEMGIALLQRTSVDAIAPALEYIDHVQIFSGDLGRFGGEADLSLLWKAHAIKELKPTIEIGWDGGVNQHNAKQIAEAGVDVLNVGGFIQKAHNPAAAYATLKALVQ